MAFTNNPKVVRAVDGGVPLIMQFREADSQSFTAGELVYLSSGYLTACADSATLVMGRALAAATNVTSGHTNIDVEVFRPGDVIMVRTVSSGTATRLTAANLGIGYGFNTVSNVGYLDTAITNADLFVPIRLLYEASDLTTVAYWCEALCNPTMCQFGTGA